MKTKLNSTSWKKQVVMKYRGNVSQTFLKSLFNRIDKERTSLHGEAQEKLQPAKSSVPGYFVNNWAVQHEF